MLLWLTIILISYLALYTWNWKTRNLDYLAEGVGLEVIGWVLAPGKWLEKNVHSFWKRYIALVDVRQENEALKRELDALKVQLIKLKANVAQGKRLQTFLNFSPPPNWTVLGASVAGQRFGPNGLFQSLLLNKGSMQGVSRGQPGMIPDGLVGKIIRLSPNFSQLLLITDPNCKVPVIGEKSRTLGICSGNGQGKLLNIDFIPQNARIFIGETIVTSGLGNIFPKGIPVGKIVVAKHSKLSLFQTVFAKPLIHEERLEEILLLQKKNKQNNRMDQNLGKVFWKISGHLP